MKRVCIHQPDFAPYLGFFHRLLDCHLFVILDDVQFIRKGSGFQNRDKIKTPRGEQWITLSVKKGPMQQRISEVYLDEGQDWIDKNLNLLIENYRQAPHFKTHFPEIEAIYRSKYQKMADFNMAFIKYFFNIFKLDIEIVYSSDIGSSGEKTERLINILKSVGATHYLSGQGARAYMDESLFGLAGLTLEWHQFAHPTYPQQHGPFIPYLSSLDVLLNCGPDCANIVRNCIPESKS